MSQIDIKKYGIYRALLISYRQTANWEFYFFLNNLTGNSKYKVWEDLFQIEHHRQFYHIDLVRGVYATLAEQYALSHDPQRSLIIPVKAGSGQRGELYCYASKLSYSVGI